MSYTNVEFVYFLLPVLLVHWLLPRRAAWQNGWLLLCSYLFYASWSPRLLVLLWLATLLDYGAALYIDIYRASPARRRLGLGVSLCFNVGLLAYFKYAGFFAASLNALLSQVGLGAPLPVLRLLLPVGISFYTFQKISYILDVYDGRLAACRSLPRFALFVAFFPQIVAGPIVRGDELLPQLAEPRGLSDERLRAGAGLFLLGFLKKGLVADYLGQNLVDPVFAQPGSYSVAGHWVALVAYAAQVYCDFAGYSEMAIGCGRLFGLELPVNFTDPYLSRSLLEFWRRWHITLNRFLFDYIYGPLTTGRGFLRGRLDLGLLVVFLLSGLWHGARWTFVLWGALHALGLIINRRWDQFYRGLCRRDRRYVALRKGAAYGAAAWALTQGFFLLSLIPFRSATLEQAGGFARGLVAGGGALLLPRKAPVLRGLGLALCALVFLGYHLLATERGQALRQRFFDLPPVLRGALYGVLVALLFLLVPFQSGAFIYQIF